MGNKNTTLDSKEWLASRPKNEWIEVNSIPSQIFWAVWDRIERDKDIRLRGMHFKIVTH